jgi:ketosteroid isomerase-like protein
MDETLLVSDRSLEDHRPSPLAGTTRSARAPRASRQQFEKEAFTMQRYFALFLLVAAVAFPLPARSSDEADAEALVLRYLSAYNAQDPVALAALYAEDGLLLPPDGGPVRGRDAIRNYWTNSGRRGLSFDILKKDLCGEAGFFVGRYRARETFRGEFQLAHGPLALLSSSQRQPEKGNFVLCVKRGETGRWRIAADMWNTSAQAGFILASEP